MPSYVQVGSAASVHFHTCPYYCAGGKRTASVHTWLRSGSIPGQRLLQGVTLPAPSLFFPCPFYLLPSLPLSPIPSPSSSHQILVPYTGWAWDAFITLKGSSCLLSSKTGLELRGGFNLTTLPDGRPGMLFTGSPRVADLKELKVGEGVMRRIKVHRVTRG